MATKIDQKDNPSVKARADAAAAASVPALRDAVAVLIDAVDRLDSIVLRDVEAQPEDK